MEVVGIRVTSLQLAVLCKQSQLLELLLSSATPYLEMKELNDVLSTRYEWRFHELTIESIILSRFDIKISFNINSLFN